MTLGHGFNLADSLEGWPFGNRFFRSFRLSTVILVARDGAALGLGDMGRPGFWSHAVILTASSPRTPRPPAARARRRARDGRRRRGSWSLSRGRGASGPAWG